MSCLDALRLVLHSTHTAARSRQTHLPADRLSLPRPRLSVYPRQPSVYATGLQGGIPIPCPCVRSRRRSSGHASPSTFGAVIAAADGSPRVRRRATDTSRRFGWGTTTSTTTTRRVLIAFRPLIPCSWWCVCVLCQVARLQCLTDHADRMDIKSGRGPAIEPAPRRSTVVAPPLPSMHPSTTLPILVISVSFLLACRGTPARLMSSV